MNRNFLSSFCFLFLTLGLLFVSSDLAAQEEDEVSWSPGEYMRQATDNVFEKASLMNALSEFTFSNDLCMGGAIISVGATIALDVELMAGQSYTFIGGGDEDVVDLDMYIVDRNGEIVASDIEDDGTPIPDFEAAYSGRYSLRLQLVSGQAPTSFISFVMLTADGTPIEEDAFDKISTSFFDSGETLHEVSEGVKWHDIDNQWCMFGMNLSNNQNWELDNLQLGTESHYIFAIGSEQSKNIDLELSNSDGKLVASDTEDDIYPIMDNNTREDQRYLLNVINKRSDGRSFILVGIVTE